MNYELTRYFVITKVKGNNLYGCQGPYDVRKQWVKHVRRPGIEPGSQEWESCMIPLHQRRLAETQH